MIAFAQTDKASTGGERILRDVFRGKVPLDNHKYATQLVLEHCKYCDEGKFVLQETNMESAPGDKPIEIKGDWTVIKGDADNQYATVVEIDAAKDTLYFLRLNSGHLEKLDAKLQEIKADMKYVLKKQ